MSSLAKDLSIESFCSESSIAKFNESAFFKLSALILNIWESAATFSVVLFILDLTSVSLCAKTDTPIIKNNKMKLTCFKREIFLQK